MATTSLILNYGDPGVIDLLRETEVLKVWEFIRQAGRVLTVHEVSEALGVRHTEMYRRIDLLVVHGLLRQVRARKPRTEVGYQAVCERIVVAFDEHDADQVERLMAMSNEHVADFESDVACYADPVFDSTNGFRFKQVSAHHFSRDELAELRRRVLSVISFLTMPRTPQRRSKTAGNEEPAAPQYCNQAISIVLEPLADGLLPLPTIITTPRSKLQQWDDSSAVAGGLGSLSPRERDVALALADGLSRARVAEQLGLSVHTVGTLVRRAYKKLGVSSQAELAARLALHDRPVPGDD